jgi:hypothetical protein
LTFKAKPSRKHPDAKVFKTDSAGAMVCTVLPPNPTDPDALRGNETTCACSSWGSLYFKGVEGEGEGASSVDYCEVGPGWKPTAAMLKAGKPKYFENNPFDSQWTAVPLAQANLSSSAPDGHSDVVTLTADLSALDGRKPLAVRLAWPLFQIGVGKADDMCCVHAASQGNLPISDGGGRAPCVPGNCPLYSSESELPANPFFATIVDGKCTCSAPQECGY